MNEMDILEKCAYIKGLADGLNLDETKAEGKVLKAVIDLLSDICETIADIDDEVAVLGDYVEEVDHDLGEVEEYVFDCDDECDCDCDEVIYEVECACGNIIEFDEETLEQGSIVCDKCGETLEFTFEDEE